MITVYIDGLAEPRNPGITSYGFVIYRNGDKIAEEYGGIGEQTNNYAEYFALVKALEKIIELGFIDCNVVIKTDSLLLANQLSGRYRVRSPNIMQLYNRVRFLMSKIKNIRIDWIPRSENIEADKLSRRGYLEYLRSHPELIEKYKRFMATPKQRRILSDLGLNVDNYLSKHEASRAIQKYLRKRSRKK